MKIQNSCLLLLSTILTFLGGFINTLGILIYSNPVSHFTGNMTNSSIAIIHGDYYIFYKMFSTIIFFLLGNIFSGYVLGEKEFNPGKRYGVIIILIGIILLFNCLFIRTDKMFLQVLSFLCGIQNGLFITYKGMTVRMTHITGGLTDMGVYIGNYLRKKHDDVWKIKFYLILIVGFFIGGLIGTLSYYEFGKNSFLLVAMGYFISGGLYFLWRSRGIKTNLLCE